MWLFAVCLIIVSWLPAIAEERPQPDRWRGLILDQSTPEDAIEALGKPKADVKDRLVVPVIEKWFDPRLKKKVLRRLTFKGIQGFRRVDLLFRDDRLVVIQLFLKDTIMPTALGNIYDLEFQPMVPGLMEGMFPDDVERHKGVAYPKRYPPFYSLVAVTRRSVVSAAVKNNSMGGLMRGALLGVDPAGAGFPGVVATLQLISRSLENRAGESLLK